MIVEIGAKKYVYNTTPAEVKILDRPSEGVAVFVTDVETTHEQSFLAFKRDDAWFFYARDLTEDVGIPMPRAPWAVIHQGSRFVPFVIVDKAGIWTPAGAEPDYGDPWVMLVEKIVNGAPAFNE